MLWLEIINTMFGKCCSGVLAKNVGKTIMYGSTLKLSQLDKLQRDYSVQRSIFMDQKDLWQT